MVSENAIIALSCLRGESRGRTVRTGRCGRAATVRGASHVGEAALQHAGGNPWSCVRVLPRPQQQPQQHLHGSRGGVAISGAARSWTAALRRRCMLGGRGGGGEGARRTLMGSTTMALSSAYPRISMFDAEFMKALHVNPAGMKLVIKYEHSASASGISCTTVDVTGSPRGELKFMVVLRTHTCAVGASSAAPSVGGRLPLSTERQPVSRCRPISANT